MLFIHLKMANQNPIKRREAKGLEASHERIFRAGNQKYLEYRGIK
jgi:hypothetical protein